MADARKPTRRSAASWLALDARRLATRLSGARMCFGPPVHSGARTVIPVATLRLRGGLGLRSPAGGEPPAELANGDSIGGGGGGVLDARPVGFIDIGPEGARYRPIRRAPGLTAPGAALGLLGAWAGARALRDRRVRGRVAALLAVRAKRPRGAALPWPR